MGHTAHRTEGSTLDTSGLHLPEAISTLCNAPASTSTSPTRRLCFPLRPPRFQRILTPADKITRRRIRRGTFNSVPDLIRAIEEYVAVHNENPKPFVWTASVQSILDKIAKVKKR